MAQNRVEIAKIRDSVNVRCGEFLLNLYGYIFKITAGVPRKDDLSLKFSRKAYPYPDKGSMKPLNFVLLKGEKSISLNDRSVPCDGDPYPSLIRGFISPEDIKTFATNI